jgi:hypothetical protein
MTEHRILWQCIRWVESWRRSVCHKNTGTVRKYQRTRAHFPQLANSHRKVVSSYCTRRPIAHLKLPICNGIVSFSCIRRWLAIAYASILCNTGSNLEQKAGCLAQFCIFLSPSRIEVPTCGPSTACGRLGYVMRTAEKTSVNFILYCTSYATMYTVRYNTYCDCHTCSPRTSSQ